MSSSTSRIFNAINDDVKPTLNSINFHEISDECNSVSLHPVQIKRPSKILPTETVISKKEAFRCGAKKGTGAAKFYGVIPAIKRAIHKLPAAKSGPLADEINIYRNEARAIYANINIMIDQFNCVMKDIELHQTSCTEAAMLSVYFLEDSFAKLKPVLLKLKMYSGLLKGNAVRGMNGFIVAGKETPDDIHPYNKMKQAEKDTELALLFQISNDHSALKLAMSRLLDIGILPTVYEQWKSENRIKIELSINNFKAAGAMVGSGIQGTIFSCINFGIAAFTLNPAIFAVGAYYAFSTVVRVSEIAIKAKLQNEFIKHFNDKSTEKLQSDISKMRFIDSVEDLHISIDTLATTSFVIVGSVYHIPITEAFRPIDRRRELPYALYSSHK